MNRVNIIQVMCSHGEFLLNEKKKQMPLIDEKCEMRFMRRDVLYKSSEKAHENKYFGSIYIREISELIENLIAIGNVCSHRLSNRC